MGNKSATRPGVLAPIPAEPWMKPPPKVVPRMDDVKTLEISTPGLPLMAAIENFRRRIGAQIVFHPAQETRNV